MLLASVLSFSCWSAIKLPPVLGSISRTEQHIWVRISVILHTVLTFAYSATVKSSEGTLYVNDNVGIL